MKYDSDASTCASYLASGTENLLAGTDADPTGSTALLLPHISINTGFVELSHTDTEVLIVNAGNAAASVTAQLVGLDGAIRGAATLSVPAKGSASDLISNLFR